MPGDDAAYQRKLDAVYDAFDRHDDKLALKLTTAALQRQPRWSVMAALRAVALDRLGRCREALEAADALLAEAPPDDHALNTLALVLKPAGRLSDLGPAFERAAAKDPADEGLAKGVFLSAVRSGDAAAIQRAALRLDKAFGAGLALKREPPQRYKWYAALAAVLQAREAALAEADERAAVAVVAAGAAAGGAAAQQPQQQRKSALLLQLAEGMVRRLNATSVKAEEVLSGGGGAGAGGSGGGAGPSSATPANPLALTREAAMLHLGLLQALGRYDEALELLQEGDGKAAKKDAYSPCPVPLPAGAYARAIPLEEERLLARAALLQARGDRAAAAELYARHLREHAPDDWASGRHYLDCLLPLSAGGAGAGGRLIPPQVPHVSSAAVAREVLGLNSGCGHADFGAGSGVVAGAATPAAAEEAAAAAAKADAQAQAQAQAAERLIAELARIQADQQAAFDAAKAKTKAKEAAASAGAEDASTATETPKPGLLPGEDAEAAKRRRRAQMKGARLPASPRFAPLLRCELALRRWFLGQAGPRALADAVAAFHASLGHLDSCFPDTRPYLEALAFGCGGGGGEGGSDGSAAAAAAAKEARAWLGGELEARASADATTDDLESLRRRVSALQMSAHLLGGCPSPAATFVARLHARTALPMAAALRLDPRERGPADELPAMVADALLRQPSSAGRAPPLPLLLKAIAHLEAACVKRPFVASTRIALCAAHGLVGSPRKGLAHFAALDAKHVQHDTLSGHLALPLQVLAFWAAGAAGSGSTPSSPLSALRGVVDLCDTHARDAGDTLHTALKNGTHTKVGEFASFRERLAASQGCLAARAEGALVLLVAGLGSGAAASASAKKPAAAAFAALAGARRALKAVVAADRDDDDADAVAATARALGLPPPRALRAPTPDALTAWSVRARFNTDLSVRPGWLPPEGGPLPFAVLRWWEGVEEGKEEQQQQRLPPWWLRPGAAEAQGVPEASALRAALRASTEQRALLQHLLVAALGLESPVSAAAGGSGGGGKRQAAAAAAAGKKAGAVTPAAASSSSSPSTPSLSELLPRLCSAVGRSVAPHAPKVAAAGSDVDAAVAAAEAVATAAPSSVLLQAADLALFAAVEDLKGLVSGKEGAGDDDRAAARSRALVALLSALEGRVEAAVAASVSNHGLLPGSALFLLSLVVWDLGERVTLCMEACAEAAGAAASASASAAASALGVCAALAALLAKVEEAAAASSESSAEATADALADELMRDPDAGDLFGEEAKTAAAREALRAVAEGQREARASAGVRTRALMARVRVVEEVLGKRV